MGERKHHFVLVHGSALGGWCWFKVASLLKKAGHEVSPVDLRASGIDLASPDEVTSFADYSRPLLDLLESIPADEKVVLVGHSSGGLSIALAVEKFPAKISVAVFVSAFMPSLSMPPSELLYNYFFVQKDRIEPWEDSTFFMDKDAPSLLPKKIDFGRKFILTHVFNNCSGEDHALATSLKRVAPFYREDLSSHNFVTEMNYGHTRRVYVLSKDDKLIKENFVKWMIEMSPVDELLEIDGADHIPMLSKPVELYRHLLHVAEASSNLLIN